jgi:hypothetical protein
MIMNDYQKHGSNFKAVEQYIFMAGRVEMRQMRELFQSIPFDEFQNILSTLKKSSQIININGVLTWNK